MHVNKKGIANIDTVLNSYMAFYIYLYNNHIKVETDKSPYNDYDYLTDKSKMKKSLLINPFEKFERKRLMNYCKDLAEIGFNNILWKQLDKGELNRIMRQMEEDLIKYYKDRLNTDLPAHVVNYFKEG